MREFKWIVNKNYFRMEQPWDFSVRNQPSHGESNLWPHLCKARKATFRFKMEAAVPPRKVGRICFKLYGVRYQCSELMIPCKSFVKTFFFRAVDELWRRQRETCQPQNPHHLDPAPTIQTLLACMKSSSLSVLDLLPLCLLKYISGRSFDLLYGENLN